MFPLLWQIRQSWNEILPMHPKPCLPACWKFPSSKVVMAFVHGNQRCDALESRPCSSGGLTVFLLAFLALQHSRASCTGSGESLYRYCNTVQVFLSANFGSLPWSSVAKAWYNIFRAFVGWCPDAGGHWIIEIVGTFQLTFLFLHEEPVLSDSSSISSFSRQIH